MAGYYSEQVGKCQFPFTFAFFAAKKYDGINNRVFSLIELSILISCCESMKTQILKIESPAQPDEIRRIARLLDQGGIAAIPTETVYGLAARVHPETLRRLDAVKERQEGKRYTLHIGDKADLSFYIPKLTAPARKLISKGWPGPITLVFELDEKALMQQKEKLGKETFDVLYSDHTIGIRCPDLPLCRNILNAAGVPLVAPSANPGSQPPAISAEQVMNYFNGKIEMIISGGPDCCRYKKSSTVVKFGADGIKVLREGIYSHEDISGMSTIRILFVCTGNTCRSPMAEAVCKKILADKIGCSIDTLSCFGYKIESAGIAAIEGLPASEEAEFVCRQFGISIAGHRSRTLTPQLIRDFDFVFAMSPAHLQISQAMSAPDAKISLLDPNKEVPDPIGRGVEEYKKCAVQMEYALKERIDDFL